MKFTCYVCGKEIDESNPSSYMYLGYSDLIHKECRKTWDKLCERINTMSDEDFYNWIEGEID